MKNEIQMEETIAKNEDELFSQISKLIDDARSHVKTAVNTVMENTQLCIMYYFFLCSYKLYIKSIF